MKRIFVIFVLLLSISLPPLNSGNALGAESALFGELKDAAFTAALDGLQSTVLAKYMDGIGKVERVGWNNGTLSLKVRLEGLSELIDVDCSDIKIAANGSTVTVGKFASNMPFAQNALNRFAAGKEFPVPQGDARMAVMAAKKVLGI